MKVTQNHKDIISLLKILGVDSRTIIASMVAVQEDKKAEQASYLSVGLTFRWERKLLFIQPLQNLPLIQDIGSGSVGERKRKCLEKFGTVLSDAGRAGKSCYPGSRQFHDRFFGNRAFR